MDPDPKSAEAALARASDVDAGANAPPHRRPVTLQVGLLFWTSQTQHRRCLHCGDPPRHRSAVLGRDRGLPPSLATWSEHAPHPVARLRVHMLSTVPLPSVPLAGSGRPCRRAARSTKRIHTALTLSSRACQLTSFRCFQRPEGSHRDRLSPFAPERCAPLPFAPSSPMTLAETRSPDASA